MRRIGQPWQEQRERDFAQMVVDAATLLGWLVYRVYDSRRSPEGWPDLVLCKPPYLLLAELKTERGRVTPAQQGWIDALVACGVDVRLWRPSDWDAIVAVLQEPCAKIAS